MRYLSYVSPTNVQWVFSTGIRRIQHCTFPENSDVGCVLHHTDFHMTCQSGSSGSDTAGLPLIPLKVRKAFVGSEV
jgi:hypothetical protein